MDFKQLRLLTVKCSYLDNDGKQCNRKAILKSYYHGNPEIYEGSNWIVAYWCLEHAMNHGYKE
jgi:hypothetical protein